MSDQNNIVPQGMDGVAGTSVPDMFRDPRPAPEVEKSIKELKQQRSWLVIAGLILAGAAAALFFLFGSASGQKSKADLELERMQAKLEAANLETEKALADYQGLANKYQTIESVTDQTRAALTDAKSYLNQNPRFMAKLTPAEVKALNSISPDQLDSLWRPEAEQKLQRQWAAIAPVVEKINTERATYRAPSAPPKVRQGEVKTLDDASQ